MDGSNKRARDAAESGDEAELSRGSKIQRRQGRGRLKKLNISSAPLTIQEPAATAAEEDQEPDAPPPEAGEEATAAAAEEGEESDVALPEEDDEATAASEGAAPDRVNEYRAWLYNIPGWAAMLHRRYQERGREATEAAYEHMELENAYEALKKENSTLNTIIDVRDAVKEALETENEAMRAEIEALKAQNEALDAELDDVHEQKDEMKGEIEALKMENKDLEAQNDALETEVQEYIALENRWAREENALKAKLAKIGDVINE